MQVLLVDFCDLDISLAAIRKLWGVIGIIVCVAIVCVI